MSKSARVVVSSKGRVVIPKYIRNKLGLHSGSELIINYKKNETLELLPIKKDIYSFFGKGKHKTKNGPVDVDEAISIAVIENDRN
ncbi:AbrB family transcriptional regulator [Rickettsia rhipicephali]|uniref:Transcriptional regulator, AbrB family protein n=1 Tax=Rickettsia rhipicephali (strain 3-7-female6-CWPP) TaxID=1105113 RepID=A0AAI8F7J8_RICR3|nr:AbrB/MazE/SpoVT family DNA-binding domain-containing protein [Rickettsia rhipicephali]AFC72365.1 Transcriptional regulator, AbrB family protein [Rickettsia rhipicephali str. 3-7-female6-CWPP]ALN41359.1 AbrB family transcriptional regulator [Rickettsia rhipicephali]